MDRIHTDRPLQTSEQPDSDHVTSTDVAQSDLSISERHPDAKASQADHSVIIGRGSKRNTHNFERFPGDNISSPAKRRKMNFKNLLTFWGGPTYETVISERTQETTLTNSVELSDGESVELNDPGPI